jgi:phosphatidylserine/phosphatidylglycerophosphate/cardiolipin synthase-like enzyme
MKRLLPIVLILYTISGAPPAILHASDTPLPLPNDTYFQTLQEEIGKAKEEIVIAVFLFKISPRRGSRTRQIEASLKAAVQRGVRVVVLLERSNRRDLTDCNETTAKQLTADGITVLFDSPRRVTHTKVVIIDRSDVLVGSHNLTESALRYNNELSMLFRSQPVARKVLKYLANINPAAPARLGN